MQRWTRATRDLSGTADAPTAPGGRRALVVSASVGGGHDGAAQELARRLRMAGWEVDVRDFLAAEPAGIGWLTRWLYFWQIRWAPWTYGLLLRLLSHPGLPLRIAEVIACLGCRRLRSWAVGADVVVSTYPLASQALGALRRRGQVTAPVITFLTDLSVHRLWVADGVDAHCALHEVTSRQVRSIDPTARVVVCSPLVAPAFLAPVQPGQRAATRAEYGLGKDDLVALIVSGSWGVGDVQDTARLLADSGQVRPLVLCGRNAELRSGLADDPRIVAVGWTDDMPAVVGCADVMVQNAGGLSSLEGLAAGLSLVSHNCLAGHGEANSLALAEAGLAGHACGRDLVTVILDSVSDRAGAPARALFDGPDPALVVQAVAGALAPGPAVPATRARRRRAGSVVAATAVGAWVATAGVAAATGSGIAVGHVQPRASHRAVVIVENAATNLDAATASRLKRLGACVIFDRTPSAAMAARLAANGVPVLSTRPGARLGGDGTPYARDRNGRLLVLLEHSNAITLAESHLHGYDPIVAKRLAMTGKIPLMHPGEILVIDAGGATAGDLVRRLDLLRSRMAADRLAPMPVTELGLQ